MYVSFNPNQCETCKIGLRRKNRVKDGKTVCRNRVSSLTFFNFCITFGLNIDPKVSESLKSFKLRTTKSTRLLSILWKSSLQKEWRNFKNEAASPFFLKVPYYSLSLLISIFSVAFRYNLRVEFIDLFYGTPPQFEKISFIKHTKVMKNQRV